MVVVVVLCGGVLYFSDGPYLEGFFAEASDKKFQGLAISSADQAKFAGSRKTLVTNILAACTKRFSDVEEGVCQATQVTNFGRWPLSEKKDEIRCKVNYYADVENKTQTKTFTFMAIHFSIYF